MANGISFPFELVDLGTATPPFKITSNPDFPTETDPVCILTNTGTPPAPESKFPRPLSHSHPPEYFFLPGFMQRSAGILPVAHLSSGFLVAQ